MTNNPGNLLKLKLDLINKARCNEPTENFFCNLIFKRRARLALRVRILKRKVSPILAKNLPFKTLIQIPCKALDLSVIKRRLRCCIKIIEKESLNSKNLLPNNTKKLYLKNQTNNLSFKWQFTRRSFQSFITHKSNNIRNLKNDLASSNRTHSKSVITLTFTHTNS